MKTGNLLPKFPKSHVRIQIPFRCQSPGVDVSEAIEKQTGRIRLHTASPVQTDRDGMIRCPWLFCLLPPVQGDQIFLLFVSLSSLLSVFAGLDTSHLASV